MTSGDNGGMTLHIGDKVTVNLHPSQSTYGATVATAIITGCGEALDDGKPSVHLWAMAAGELNPLALGLVPVVDGDQAAADEYRGKHDFQHVAWTAATPVDAGDTPDDAGDDTPGGDADQTSKNPTVKPTKATAGRR